MSKDKVLILCGCKYPEGDAGSVRVHALAKLLVLCGKEVVVIGKGNNCTTHKESTYDGIAYYSFRYYSNSLLGKIADRVSYTKRLKRFLEKDGRGKGFSDFIIVDIPFSAIRYARRFAKANGIHLIHDSMEWYSPSQFRFGRLNPMYIHRDRLNSRIIDKDFRIIAISRFLEDYYKQKGCQTIRIPAILTTQNAVSEKATPDKWIITYAGLPEKKDKLIEIMESYISLDKKEQEMIELRIVGVTLAAMAKRFGLSSEAASRFKNIVFYGRLPRKETLEKLQETHFTIFYRDANERYAKAGFPTKVAESTSMGIPIITNLSSDLSLYLKNMENSIVIDESGDGIKNALSALCTLSNDAYNRMRKNALDTYNQFFYYADYKSDMESFLS